MDVLATFCRQVRSRSLEHQAAMPLLLRARLLGLMVSVLRQEVDSLIRVIYLLSIADRSERQRLIEASVNGKLWSHKGMRRRITDKEMAQLADRLTGWTASVYKFGCAFVHLSAFHDYSDRDPLVSLPEPEKADLLRHIRHYHGGPMEPQPRFADLAVYFPRVLEKVAGNLECSLKRLEEGEKVDGP